MISVDVPPVEDEEEALTMMVHFLGLASSYFEASPENVDLCKRVIRHKLNDHAAPAALVWFDAMEAAYPKE